GDGVVVVEGDDAGVVAEDREAPVALERARRGEDRLLQQVLVGARRAVAGHGDRAGQRLVLAVLRPGLRQRLELDVGWVAALLPEEGLDRLHLLEVEREQAVTADAAQRLVVGLTQRDLDAPERRRRQLRERDDRLLRIDAHLLDQRIGEEA